MKTFPVLHFQHSSSNVKDLAVCILHQSLYIIVLSTAQEFAGLAKAGKAIQDSQELFLKVIEQVVKLASLQTAFAALDEVIKITNRRVNALEYVVIPKVEGIIHYIEGEMSESEREEFFRLKMMQKTKKRKADEEEAAAKLLEQQAIEAGLLPPGMKGNATTADMLGGDDEDIVV